MTDLIKSARELAEAATLLQSDVRSVETVCASLSSDTARITDPSSCFARIKKYYTAQSDEVERLRTALISIAEYWNGAFTDTATSDAAATTREIARAALNPQTAASKSEES